MGISSAFIALPVTIPSPLLIIGGSCSSAHCEQLLVVELLVVKLGKKGSGVQGSGFRWYDDSSAASVVIRLLGDLGDLRVQCIRVNSRPFAVRFLQPT